MTDTGLIATGEAGKREGMERAAAKCPAWLKRKTWAELLCALLDSPTGKATLEDATPNEDLAKKFPDLGKWRGAAVNTLARRGFIRRVGSIPAMRPASHRSMIAVWRLDVGKRVARNYLRILEMGQE